MSELVGHPYAGFWRRFAAYLIDGLLLGGAQVAIGILVQSIAPNDLRTQANVAPVGLLIDWAYFALLESSPAQATVGKMALDIYVTDGNGDPIDFRRASVRFWSKLLDGLPLALGWLLAAFSPTKRALHDYMAGTLVLRRATVALTQSPADAATEIGDRWDGTRWTFANRADAGDYWDGTRWSSEPSALVAAPPAPPPAPPALVAPELPTPPAPPIGPAAAIAAAAASIAPASPIAPAAPIASVPPSSPAPPIAPAEIAPAAPIAADLHVAPAPSDAFITTARAGIAAAVRVLPWADLMVPIALGFWVIGIAGVNRAAINDFGLIPALPATYFIALLVFVISLGLVLHAPDPSRWRLVVHLLALVLMLQGTLPLVLSEPQYAYVFKHFGVVDYIATHGSVNTNIDIYQNWPTFFALGAWFDKVAGVSSPIGYAAWAPAYFDLAALLAINASLRVLTSSVQARWLALFLFVATNWVGQDYFSPQAFAFVLSQAVVACLLTWFRPAKLARWVSRFERGLRIALRAASEQVAVVVRPEMDRRRRGVLLALIFGLFTVVTISHQLSPYMVIAFTGVLTVIGALRPRWIVVGFVFIAGSYLVLHYDFLNSHGDLLLSLNPFQNAQNPQTTPNDGVFGRVVTAYSARTLSLAMWLLALVGAVRKIRAGGSATVPLGLMLGAFLIVFGVEYGGEAIYRVYLFALPWAALLVAFAVAPKAWTRWASVRASVVLVVVLGLFLQAYFGLTEVNQVRPTEVAASHFFNEHASAGSVLVLAAPNFPERSTGTYAEFVITSGAFDPQLLNDPKLEHRMLGVADLPEIEAIVKSYAPHGYLAITTGMKVYSHVFKLLPDGSLDSLDQALAASPQWSVFYRNQDAVIYEFVG